MKTYVLDASALYVYLQDKPAANKVNQLLKEAVRERAEILMSAVNYGEVYGAILREHGPGRAAATMNAVQPLPIRLVDATPQRGVHAAEVKAKYKLYCVDSFAAAPGDRVQGHPSHQRFRLSQTRAWVSGGLVEG